MLAVIRTRADAPRLDASRRPSGAFARGLLVMMNSATVIPDYRWMMCGGARTPRPSRINRIGEILRRGESLAAYVRPTRDSSVTSETAVYRRAFGQKLASALVERL